MDPPYLFDQYDPATGAGVDVGLDVDSSLLTLAVHGTWERRLCRDTHTAVRKCLSEHPATLLIDLQELADPFAASIPTWLTARRLGVPMAPPVEVMVCVPDDNPLSVRLHRMGAERILPIYPTMARARAAAAEQVPLTGRLEMRLGPDGGAAAAARGVVTNACIAWRLPELQDRARLVVSELVLNAIEHAGTSITVIISRRGDGLHLAVGDGDPRLPRLSGGFPALPPDDAAPQRGSGLHVVHAAATLWGAMPTHDGKVVWATIRPWNRR
ncbi:ATP-binding protein [Actinoplanes oblitus]|uniref:ATP-binding protein n=1 Tax=Actinoplanes oblitus TaxID=3040509 RepID=A0ABY8W5N3_9ACTN|nr:ATP-binding protein [Actinoplanes oblitus]WIM93130.1 ATP-binding protein [Actinoplanes oblitus]